MGLGSSNKSSGNGEKQTEPVDLADVILNTLQGQRIYYPIGGEADTLRLPSRNGAGTFSEIDVPAIVFNGSQWSFSPDLVSSSLQEVSINGITLSSIGTSKDTWARLVAEMMDDFVVRYFDGYSWREVYMLKVGGYFVETTRDQLLRVCQELVAIFDEPDMTRQILELQNRLIRLLLHDSDGQPEVLVSDLTPGLSCEQSIGMQTNQSSERELILNELQRIFNLGDAQDRLDMLLDRFRFKLLSLADEMSLPLPQGSLKLIVGGSAMGAARLAYEQRLSEPHLILIVRTGEIPRAPIQLLISNSGDVDLVGNGEGINVSIPPSAPQTRHYHLGEVMLTLRPVDGKLHILCNSVQGVEA